MTKKAAPIFQEDWKALVLEEYREGNSDAAVRSLLAELRLEADTCSAALFNRWIEEDAEFADVIDHGRQLAEAWWTNLGKEVAAGRAKTTPAVWIFTMKNRFNWVDKKELSGSDGGAIKIEIFQDEEDV